MRHFLIYSLVLLLVGLSAPARGADKDARQPNIILILADDLGYECIGANGGTSYKTPVLDGLAAAGVRFEHCYVQPLCTPTRIQLMTGQYNIRNYTQFGEMNSQLTTFANLFQKSGYATCIVGKWQLGRDLDKPKKFGFDEYCLWQHMRRPSRYKNPGLEVNGRQVDYDDGEYGPDIINNYALEFIERHKDKPFLLYYPMVLPHGPFEPTPDSLSYDEPLPKQAKAGKNRGKKKKQRSGAGVNSNFRDMVQYMDKLVGRLVTKLKEQGLRDNTLIVFVGDNGTGKGLVSRMGDRQVPGGKGELNAAGMHVPLIVNWPGKVQRDKVCADLIDSTDFLPTICQAAGVKIPEEHTVDGRTFWPQLRGEEGQPRHWYYSWYAPRGELVGEFAATHRYKLYRDGRFFDLQTDQVEEQPLNREELSGDASEAARLLTAALEKYKDARPAGLALSASGEE